MTRDRQPSQNKLSEFHKSKLPQETIFDIPPATEDFVLKRLTSLEDDKAVGLDEISSKLVHIGANSLPPGITMIQNLSISTGIFP